MQQIKLKKMGFPYNNKNSLTSATLLNKAVPMPFPTGETIINMIK